jgi:uncharacterized membrane protein YecN with MAPEG domain
MEALMVRLEIAAIYAGANILILLLLAFFAAWARQRKQVVLGDGGDPDLLRAQRAHANAAEYIPAGIAGLTLLALLEPASPLWLLHASGICLTAGRALHGIGLSLGVLNAGRIVGVLLTWAALLMIGVGLVYAGLQQGL